MVNHLNGGNFPKAVCKQNAALCLEKSWWPKVSCIGGMREAARVNSGFRKGGNGRINNGCIQKVGECKGVDSSSIVHGLAVLVLLYLACLRVLATLALFLLIFVSP